MQIENNVSGDLQMMHYGRRNYVPLTFLEVDRISTCLVIPAKLDTARQHRKLAPAPGLKLVLFKQTGRDLAFGPWTQCPVTPDAVWKCISRHSAYPKIIERKTAMDKPNSAKQNGMVRICPATGPLFMGPVFVISGPIPFANKDRLAGLF